MSQEKTHDLHDFMQQLQDRMAAHYRQIQKRASEDPGTAGDQGEENWCDLLSGWLPRTYEVVTKGRIISQDGQVSPQVDVLVLKSIYPKQLIDEGQKIYLAAGVAAAFECKTTLTAADIEKTVKNCVKIKNLYPVREGTPYKELHAPIVCGLLAHSHSWKAPNSTPENNIEQKLHESDASYVSHPRLGLDILCVVNLATWTLSKTTFIDAQQMSQWLSEQKTVGGALSVYIGHMLSPSYQAEHFTPVGTLIANLSRRLAWEDSTLRDLADYYRVTNMAGSGHGNIRIWPDSIYTKEVKRRFETDNLSTGKGSFWDEWSSLFY